MSTWPSLGKVRACSGTGETYMLERRALFGSEHLGTDAEVAAELAELEAEEAAEAEAEREEAEAEAAKSRKQKRRP